MLPHDEAVVIIGVAPTATGLTVCIQLATGILALIAIRV